MTGRAQRDGPACDRGNDALKRQRGHVQWRLLDVLERGSAKFDVARLGPHA
jgi:hypothetical protein